MPQKKFYVLISGLDTKLANATDRHAILCKIGTIEQEKAKEKILVCSRGETARVEKSLVAMEAGAFRIILCNDKFSEWCSFVESTIWFNFRSCLKKEWWNMGCF
ncbi:hypothetical protein AHAS_Ahas03G0067300 [Arachis hypogaea]